MNIAFDAGAIEIGKGSGIGNYTLNQFKKMIELAPQNQYYYFNCIEDSHLTDCLTGVNFHKCYYDMGPNQIMRHYNGRYQDVYGELIKGFIRKYQIDIFYITSPFFAENVLYRKEWFLGSKVVATAWDIIPYVMRKQYLSDRKIYKWYMDCIDMLRATDRQLAISNSVKEDMVNYLDFDPERIDIIYGGVSEHFRQLEIKCDEQAALYKKFGITSDFILCCVSADQRKNVKGAIKAFAKMSKLTTDSVQMVIAGRILPEKEIEFTQLIHSLHMTGRILLTGYVTDEELLFLYNLAKLMIFPSLYEGFGLPALEAWACGTPVIASNNSSLGEIVGDAGLLFDPTNSDDISRVMEFALTEANLDVLIEKGREKVGRYTWDYVAQLTIDSLETVNRVRGSNPFQHRERVALVYSEGSLSKVWRKLPELLSDRFCVDVFSEDPTSVEDEAMKIRFFEDLEVHSSAYDWIMLVSPAALTRNTQCYPTGKTVWIQAEERLEGLLRVALGFGSPTDQTLCDVELTRLSSYFKQNKPALASLSYDKALTANKEEREKLLKLSMDHPVYLIDTNYQSESVSDVDPHLFREMLTDNIEFAIKDRKPWGAGEQWSGGEKKYARRFRIQQKSTTLLVRWD